MYSEDLINYLYSYNMPKKGGEDAKNQKSLNKGKGLKHKDFLCTFKRIYATVPVEFGHE